jgi:predicted RNA-binding Zn ribbon-like protein
MTTRPFRESGNLAVDLVNTWDAYLVEPERLPDAAALRAFLGEYGLPGRPRAADLAECRTLRATLRDVVGAPSADELVDRMDRLAASLRVVPRVSRRQDGRPGLTLEPASRARPAERLAVRAVVDLATVVEEHGAERIRTCRAAPCIDLFVDLSKNGTRRYCSRRCANRRNAALHRARTG